MKNKKGNKDHLPSRQVPVIDKQRNGNKRGNQEIGQTDHHTRRRNNQTGKINLGNQLGIVQQRLAPDRNRVAEKLPDQHRSIYRQRIGNVVGGKIGYFFEHHGKYYHSQQRTDDAPGNPYCCLLISNYNIPPGKNQKQFPVMPEIPQIPRMRMPGSDNQKIFFRSVFHNIPVYFPFKN